MNQAAIADASPLILIIEDEPDIAEIIQAYLLRDGFASQYCSDGQRGLQYLRQAEPDLVLLDIRMPGQNGIDVLQAIRAQSNTPVIVLTALTDDMNKLLTLRLGADDYITKPFNPEEMLARIHAVLRRSHGSSELRDDKIRIGPLLIDNAVHAAFVIDPQGHEQLLPLTLTEYRLLAFMARRPRHCISRYELIEGCMPESDAMDRVIDSHLSKLRRKLSDVGCGHLIETVRGVGYRLWQTP